jgi:hypothetical protein
MSGVAGVAAPLFLGLWGRGGEEGGARGRGGEEGGAAGRGGEGARGEGARGRGGGSSSRLEGCSSWVVMVQPAPFVEA